MFKSAIWSSTKMLSKATKFNKTSTVRIKATNATCKTKTIPKTTPSNFSRKTLWLVDRWDQE